MLISSAGDTESWSAEGGAWSQRHNQLYSVVSIWTSSVNQVV